MNSFNKYERDRPDEPIIIMMVGLPGSGKSTYANNIVVDGFSAPKVISSDKIREELYGDENTQGNPNEVFELLHNRIRCELLNGNDVVYDATNVNKKKRVNFLKSISNIKCNKLCICIMTEYVECLYRNTHRNRLVPDEVIWKMLLNWQPPHKNEGFDQIDYVFDNDGYGSEYDLELFLNQTRSFNQENSHHDLSLGDHCEKAMAYIMQNYSDFNLGIAAMIHDNGKIETKTRLNSRGIDDGNCHYYQHHCVGAYKSLFFLKSNNAFENDDMMDISNLIYYHMHPYNEWKNSEKCMERHKRIIGDEFFNRVMKLHEADVYAH